MSDYNKNQEAPIVSHLAELQKRLTRIVSIVFLTFISLVYLSNEIYELVSSPLIAVLPEGASMIATNVAAPFFAPLKLTAIVACFISLPAVMYQIWLFIAPGLYKNEKNLVVPLVFCSVLLFYSGVAFTYFVVLPLVFSFFTNISPENVTVATDISNYLDFVLKILFGFGIAFEIPIVTIFLCWSNIATPDELRQKRPYIIVSCFVVAMLLTPPDIISQSLLAIPMLLLFEVGLYASRFYCK